MNCPYCNSKMEKGRISSYAMFHPLSAATIKFIPEDKNMQSKKAQEFDVSEGYYCSSCHKIIGCFNAK